MANTTYRNLTGFDGISAVLQGLPKAMRANLLASAVGAGAMPVTVAAKRYARRSRDTGALEASLDDIVRKYPAHATATAIIGPSKGYFQGRRKLGQDEARQGAEQPSRRAHLIEFGHRTRQPRQGGQSKPGKLDWVPPQPFMRPAVATTGPQVEAAMVKELGAGIERTRRKLIKTGAHSA